jgi:hypothetical protein
MTDDDFYAAVADLLGATHEGSAFPHDYRTRWNDRGAGRGRYPGFGTVRLFGDTVHVSLRRPLAVCLVVEGREQALEALRAAVS